MWFKVENKRVAKGQKYTVRCATDVAGSRMEEEKSAQGAAAARQTAEMLAESLNRTATVYGADAEGEFVFGVYEVAEDVEDASSPLIKRLYAESAAASLTLKDKLLADIPEETIRGFAALSASLGYLVSQHKAIKRAGPRQIGYASLFRIFCGDGTPDVLSLDADAATLALLGKKVGKLPGWMWLSEIKSVGAADKQAILAELAPTKITLNIDGELQILQPQIAFRGVAPGSGGTFLLVMQGAFRPGQHFHVGLDSVAIVYRESDEAEVVALVRGLLKEANPFKNRVVLVNRDLRTVRSRISDRSWNDVIPHERAREELDFIAASIRNREMLREEGLTIKRGLLLSGPPGDGKSTAIECFVNGIAGEATVIIVEAVDHIRAIYHLAQSLAPCVVILEDLDLMTKSRQVPFTSGVKDDVTGELLQVLSGGSAYSDVITIATTNHPEAIDEALAKRAGRFDAHVRMGYPDEENRRRILDLYLTRFAVDDELTRRRLHVALAKDLGRLHLVPAHIEEFVKAGVKRARLARRAAEYSDFEPGIEAVKSIATAKPAIAGVG